jgi:CBS-domain-containing membrane protein
VSTRPVGSGTSESSSSTWSRSDPVAHRSPTRTLGIELARAGALQLVERIEVALDVDRGELDTAIREVALQPVQLPQPGIQ